MLAILTNLKFLLHMMYVLPVFLNLFSECTRHFYLVYFMCKAEVIVLSSGEATAQTLCSVFGPSLKERH